MSTPTDTLHEQALQAERALLGAVLVDPTRLVDAGATVTEASFYRVAHQLLWRVITTRAEARQPCDLVTVCGALTPTELEAVGGPAYVAGLTDGMPRSANAAYYAGLVRDAAARRQVEAFARQLLAEATSGESDPAALVTTVETGLGRLRSGLPAVGLLDPPTRATRAMQAMEQAATGALQRTMSRIAGLDHICRGWRGGQLVVLGARPAMGKSALAMALAVAAGEQGAVLFVSLEMGADELGLRELGLRAGIPPTSIEHYATRGSGAQRVSDAVGAMGAGGVYLLDQAGARVSQVYQAASRLKAQHSRVSLVIIDYLQLMRAEPGQRADNRTVEVGQLSGGLKRLARDLDVPVLALSQLSRASEARSDKRPQLSDLRESGSIEQDADCVMLLHRPGYYSGDPADTSADLDVKKHRSGPTGSVKLVWRPETMQFVDAGGMTYADQ